MRDPRPFVLCLTLAGFAAASVVVMAGCPGSLDDPESFDAARPGGGGAGGAGGGAGGAGDSGSGSDGGGGGCGDVPTTLLAVKCATSGCHNKADHQSNLDMESPGLVGRVKNVATMGKPEVLLLDTASPEKSALYTKVTSTPGFGSRMPLGGKLDDASIACVKQWVNDAAKMGDAGK